MKNKIAGLFWVVIIVGGAVWFLSDYLRQCHNQQQATLAAFQKEHNFAASVAALALKYNAVTNWESSMSDRGHGPFSIDLSRALIPTNGQPLLVVMTLLDIEENNGIYTAYFSKDDNTNNMLTLAVHLKCTEEQSNYLLKRVSKDSTDTFAVVARFNKVYMPRFRMRGPNEGEDEENVSLSYSTNFFIAWGTCLELLK